MTVTGPRLRARGLRATSVAAGAVAAVAMIVVGCQSITTGSPSLDAADVPLYRASTSSSLAASSSSSAARESQRQEAAVKEAVHTSCEALSSSSVDAIAAVNSYVDAVNQNSVELVARAGPAVDGLNRTADVVAASMTDPLSQELRDALNEWVDSARALSVAIGSDAPMSEFNVSIERVNVSQDLALDLCDALY